MCLVDRVVKGGRGSPPGAVEVGAVLELRRIYRRRRLEEGHRWIV